MADTTAIAYIIPIHKDGLEGIRTIKGNPVTFPAESTLQLILGVYDALGAFEATPTGTNLEVKIHALDDAGVVGAELTSSNTTGITTTTEENFKAKTGHAIIEVADSVLPIASYAGGGLVRLSLWIDAVEWASATVKVIDPGGSVILGTVTP